MTEFNAIVELQRTRLAAEEWAKQITSIQIHSLKSMWYETEESREDFEDGCVTDTHYGDGHIKRSQNGKFIRTFGNALVGEELLEAYISNAM